MRFFRRIFDRLDKIKMGDFFSSDRYDMNNFFCGIGKSEVLESTIRITNYPFEPSLVYPEKELTIQEIISISWDSYPPLIRIENEVIFISRENAEELGRFVERNKIEIFESSRSWDLLLEPFLDTEYTEETDQRIISLLKENGIDKEEVHIIRNELKEQMMKYNFDTMLWEWGSLGLQDVLSAMRLKYSKQDFIDFYRRAMEIQLRTK